MRITIARILFLFMLIIISNQLLAANRYWFGLPGNWSAASSWSSTTSGLGGAGAPGPNDNVFFDGGPLGLRQGKCTIDAAVSVASITITSGYNGTIVQGANSIAVAGAASFGSGTFTGGTANISIGGLFTLSGTAFTSTSAVMELQGDAAFTGGSFAHHNGWVRFNDAAAENITGTSPDFYDLEFTGRGNSYTISSTGNIGVANSLNISGSSSCILNTGSFNVNGNIILTNTSTGDGGTATINITGSGAQSVVSALSINQSTLPSININKSGGTLVFPALITVMGNWTYTAGAIDAATNNSTVVFDNSLTITGSHTLNHVQLEGANNWTITISAGTVLTLNGNLSMTGSGNLVLNTGTINLNGNLNLSNTATGGGGTGTIAFVGTAGQSISSALAVNQNNLPAVTINKASGTLTFPALITVCGNWTYLAGTMDLSTSSSTIVFAKTLTISGNSHALNNVVFEGNNNWTFTVNTGTILTVTGTLITNGASNVFINTPVAGATAIQAQGDILVSNSSTTGGGNGLLLINGAGAQAFTSTSAASQGLLPYIKIQKTAGTLTLQGTISESRDWVWASGTVAPATSTVVFGGNSLSVTSAGMSFYNVAVTTNTATLTNSLTALNNLTISGSAVLAPGSNTINLGGNWSDWGNSGLTEATSTVNLNGAASQTISSAGGENFTNLTINNSGAGVSLSNNVFVAGTLTMTRGNVNLNSSALGLGSSVANKGILNYTSGNLFGSGSFVRWFNTSTIANGSVSGLFPMGTATDTRPFYVSAPATGPSTGGTISVSYTDAATNTIAPGFSDGAAPVAVRKNLNWTLSTGSGLTGGNYNLDLQGTHFGIIGAVSDLRLTLAGSVLGAAGTNAGTTDNPQVNRTGLTAANLSNTFYLASVDAVSSPLPVSLVSFTAAARETGVLLQWTTAAEFNNDHFEVERSAEGKRWDELETVKGSGNTNTDQNYIALDASPYNGTSYYRLLQVDEDGKENISPVVSVHFALQATVSVHPNPVSNSLTVQLPASGTYDISLLNQSGQSLKRIQSAGSRSDIDVSNLPVGIYFLRIDYANRVQTKEILVRR